MPSRSHRHAECGATLLEVVIACALAALLVSIAVPNAQAMRAPFAVRSASRQIEADLQAARMRAITRNARYRVSFNNTGTGYSLERETSNNTFTAEGGLQMLPQGVALGTITGTALFDTRGMITAAVAIPVTATGAHTKTVTLNVLGQTTIN